MLKFRLISLFYLLFIIVMLGLVLRKHLCTNCYYYNKRCNTGWGILAKFLYEEKSGDFELGLKLAKFTWATITIFPIIIMGVEVHFNMLNPVILGIFVILSGFNFLIHSYACKTCKMKEKCYG